MPSAATTPPSTARTILHHAWLPLVMGLIMCLAYLGGFHRPVPHDLPVAVVGSGQTASATASQLESSMGEKLDVRTLDDTDQARRLLKEREIVGAYVPGGDAPKILVAPAAGDITSMSVQKIFEPLAAEQGEPGEQGEQAKIVDVVPLPEDDPLGQNAFFYLVALSVSSYAVGIAIGAAGARARYRTRMAVTAGAAVVVPLAMMAIAVLGFDLFAGHVAAVLGLSVVYSAGVIAVCVGLHPLVTRFSTMLYASMFVGLNFTSSGGILAPELQAKLFRSLHEVWIGAGFIEAERNIASFPDASLTQPLLILFGWVALGLVCLGVGFAVETVRRRAAVAGDVGMTSAAEVPRTESQTGATAASAPGAGAAGAARAAGAVAASADGTDSAGSGAAGSGTAGSGAAGSGAAGSGAAGSGTAGSGAAGSGAAGPGTSTDSPEGPAVRSHYREVSWLPDSRVDDLDEETEIELEESVAL